MFKSELCSSAIAQEYWGWGGVGGPRNHSGTCLGNQYTQNNEESQQTAIKGSKPVLTSDLSMQLELFNTSECIIFIITLTIMTRGESRGTVCNVFFFF